MQPSRVAESCLEIDPAPDVRTICVLRDPATFVLLHQVVIVGHALHHDLKALRLDYRPVVDTSLLFSYRCAWCHCGALEGAKWEAGLRVFNKVLHVLICCGGVLGRCTRNPCMQDR